MKGDDVHLNGIISHRDAIGLLEIIHQCVLCANEEQFRKIERNLRSLISYDYAISVVAEIGGNGAIKNYDAVNLSYPSEWIAKYIVDEEHRRDPILRANYQNFRLQYFQDILRQYDHPREFKAVANDFGIVGGYVHGIRNHSGTYGSMFCFAGRRIARDKRMEAILELIVPHLHQAFERITRSERCNGRNLRIALSPKEREVLKWLRQGKSTWDISTLLKISERTVKFHVSNIMQKLDASSRTHAVAIAIEQGLVAIE